MTRINILGGLISVTLGGSVTNPGGNNLNVQFNDGGSFGGVDAFEFDKAANTVYLGSTSVSGVITAPAGNAVGTGLALLVRAGGGGATSGNGGALTLSGGIRPRPWVSSF